MDMKMTATIATIIIMSIFAGYLYLKGINLGMRKAATRIADRDLSQEEADQFWLDLQMKQLVANGSESFSDAA